MPANDAVPNHREFQSADKRRWQVWEVKPDTVTHEYLREGWLCFESDAERRRFAPIPAGWQHLSDERLRVILDVAAPVQKR